MDKFAQDLASQIIRNPQFPYVTDYAENVQAVEYKNANNMKQQPQIRGSVTHHGKLYDMMRRISKDVPYLTTMQHGLASLPYFQEKYENVPVNDINLLDDDVIIALIERYVTLQRQDEFDQNELAEILRNIDERAVSIVCAQLAE